MDETQEMDLTQMKDQIAMGLFICSKLLEMSPHSRENLGIDIDHEARKITLRWEPIGET